LNTAINLAIVVDEGYDVSFQNGNSLLWKELIFPNNNNESENNSITRIRNEPICLVFVSGMWN
jgi:hypothetical protein